MKAKELRIGSYYNYDGDSIKLDGSTLASYLQNDTDLYLEPIPLTEEWLLKFGFENNELVDKHLIFIWYGDHVGIKGMLGIIKPWSCIYVHQLQNLYFALTNEELTYD